MLINKNLFPGEGFADPHAHVENGRVYIISGHDQSPRTTDTWRMDKWQIISSDDLINWRKEGEILPTETYIGDQPNCWAGYIQEKGGKYYWYFSNNYYDTGVVVADKIEGPYVDVLGKPLIPAGFADTRSYDPCVFEENGVYTIFFGSGHYYCATLGEDMMSLASGPIEIHVYDDDGNECSTSDKSTVFKIGDIYYLAYGNRYATSDNLYGPYKFRGAFIGGGHNDVFEFKGKRYLCNEFHDTSIFFRGIRVMELNFNEDGTVIIDKDDEDDMADRKEWDFAEFDRHWFMANGDNCNYEKGGILYDTASENTVQSPLWPGVNILPNTEYKFALEIDNTDNAPELTLNFCIAQNIKFYWLATEEEVTRVNIVLNKNNDGIYECVLPKFDGEPIVLRSVAISANTNVGTIKIKKATLTF